VSKTAADARAEAQYEEFAARRRALLEAEAEREHSHPLEDAARKLPDKPKRNRP
jgi:hypothetical protein